MRCLLLVTLLVAVVPCSVTSAQVLGSMDLQDCIMTEHDFVCEAKTVFTVSVSFGLETTLDVVQITGDPPQQQEETVFITISKTPPKLHYPLRYFHTVAYFPYEEVIKVPHAPGQYPLCIDCPTAPNPTAGWTMSGGDRIPHSQGFCSSNTFYEFLRNQESCSWRRGEQLIGRATVFNPFSTGHALRMGDLFYHGYEIGQYSKFYEVTVTLKKGERDGNLVHDFVLTPAEPIYDTQEDPCYPGPLDVRANLLGDMDEYKGEPDLSNYILYIPAAPDTHPYVQNYQHNMLLVPREEMSKDGSEPDKVGVSFHTFRLLGNTWMISEAGDGLHNQLYHKHNADLSKLAQNPDAETTWLVHGKKVFKSAMSFLPQMEKVLQYQVNEIDNSLLSLTMDVNSLKTIETESIGAINEAYVEKFTSMSNEGTLVVEIQNYGAIKTDYIVTATDFNMNILDKVPAQARTLDSGGIETLNFDISTKDNLDTTNQGWVRLKSPTGKLYDEVKVIFDTKKHKSDYSWELQEKNEGSQASTDVDPDTVDIMDFDFDGIVDFRDLAAFARHWLHPN